MLPFHLKALEPTDTAGRHACMYDERTPARAPTHHAHTFSQELAAAHGRC